MSLDKAIKHGKEHRKPYNGGKAVDEHCRNNGGRRHTWECEYCKNNRTYKNKKREEATMKLFKDMVLKQRLFGGI